MRTLATLLGIAAFAGVLAWTTLGGGGVECEVCVGAGGRSYCATAAAGSRDEAVEGATRTACGTVGGSMAGELECTRRPPVSVTCSP